jgi:DNA/RNA endonuclease YhcR with UshA esterase domain
MSLMVRRRCVVLLFAFAAAAGAAQAGVISDRDVLKHVGERVTVEGIVTGTHVSAKGTEFLNFGDRYPNQDFTVVIFARSVASIGDVARLYGKRIDVTGAVELYRGRPEIVVNESSQIRTR